MVEVPATTPNIIFILTDDLDKATLEAPLDRMPSIKSLIADQGATFDNFYVSESMCCPSRATILTGEYVHNHGVEDNYAPDGGFAKFRDMGHEERTIAAHLKPLGYTTGLFGKYVNEYGPKTDSSTHVPPYWDRWFATFNEKRYRWRVNDDGTETRYGKAPADYSDNVIGEKARSFISDGAADSPFFAYVAPHAPHEPLEDPPDHTTEFADEIAPRNPNFDEADVSDKPEYVSKQPFLTDDEKLEIDQNYPHRLRMLLAVDDMVGAIVNDLEAAGDLDNTYIFVTSDNGLMQGEHRRGGAKHNPYEEASHVPLLVRGPGIAPGTRISELTLNTDFFATFADMAGDPADRDGRSLLPLLNGNTPTSRRNQLHLGNPGSYYGIRTERYKYVEWDDGDMELYDLQNDPYELQSIHADADPTLVEDLKAKLDALKSCTGQSCREAEDAF